MSFEFFRFPSLQPILEPSGAVGWMAWFLFLTLTLWLAWQDRSQFSQWTRREWQSLALLALLIPISIATFLLRLPVGQALPLPGLAAPAFGPLLPVLGALPWMLGLILLGTLPGTALAALSGLLMALGYTRSPFTPLEYAFLAALFGTLLHQSYRTPFFATLRKPWAAALLLSAFYPLLYIVTALFWTGNNFVGSLDFALSRVFGMAVAVAAELLFSAALIEIVVPRLPLRTLGSAAPRPSPVERSLQARFLATLGPLVAVLFLALGVLIWVIAGRAASQMLTSRMRSSTAVAAEAIPLLLETGQNLILQLATDQTLFSSSPSELRSLFEQHLQTVPYFEQFVLLDLNGDTVAAYPLPDFENLQSEQQELDAIARAFNGVPLQFFSVPPLNPASNAAQLSFVTAVKQGGVVRGVLIGRTALSTNPFAQPILGNLADLNEVGGQGLLLDGEGRIVFQSSGETLLVPYGGQLAVVEPLFYEDVGPEGARRLVAFQPARGSNWSVVARLPIGLIQQTALGIALPALGLLLILALLAYFLLNLSLRRVNMALQNLVLESQRIASGDLEAPLNSMGADEVGRLGQAMEKMRQMLKARLEEIQRLLSVSQGVAASLDVRSQIDPILDAALAGGGSAARLVLRNTISPEFAGEELVAFGRGNQSDVYQALDAEVLNLTRQQARILLTNPGRARLNFGSEKSSPLALAAFALNHEGEHLGALWLTYDRPQDFEPEKVRYLMTLAEQASLAAANARLYLNASLGQQRLEALLSATPDPVLLTDMDGRLVLTNPASLELFEKKSTSLLGMHIEEVLEQEEWLALFRGAPDLPAYAEISFGQGRVFYASVTPIEVQGEWLGRACILREITQFKQAEIMRTEFLSTVSHELRDPLELMRGYLTMLDMVGELNEKQSAYTIKLGQSVEAMSRLVASLLDLERIESVQGLQVEGFAITELIEEVSAEIRPRAIQKQIGLEFQLPDGATPTLEADRTLLQRALYNLLDNAIRHSPRNGKVEMWLAFTSDTLTIAIRDQGAGIALVDLPHVFDRLSRRSDQAGSTYGSLGLAIVKSIFERHNGKVWAESELGGGSTFYGQIPLKRAS